MEEVLLARWQFGITTVYHWLFVPITLGITWMVAIMETAWVRTKKPEYLRMTKFWGNLGSSTSPSASSPELSRSSSSA
jgi:cytochrome d ubiquinol oxidase subunit I